MATWPEGINLYRIKAVSLDGKTIYSDITVVANEKPGTGGLHIFPNPSKGSINMVLQDLSKGTYAIRIVTLSGQLVWAGNLLHDGINKNISLTIPTVKTGLYQLVLKGNEKQSCQQLLVD